MLHLRGDVVSEPDLTRQARTRLRRIEGQVRGLQAMLDRLAGERASQEAGCEPCDNLLTQILAVRAAVEQVGLLILEIHLQRCVLDGLPVDEEKLRELRHSLRHWSRLSSTAR
ncbi:MAG: hypothetical protein A2148_08115 [Chloroflexi bacterium RBG_16_68_14]|nr:MAG: hypothetical protein A2148_08115 [Chloroflexi bacterium RBG_16_68_14]